jgi:aryl-alcohol dehydrogenase-like predicted oxidoreductase
MRIPTSPKLLLGGANLGSLYGVSNKTNPTPQEVSEIVDKAFEIGFVGVDTAPVYGDSEIILGKSKLAGKEVFSKVSAEALGVGVEEAIRAVIASIKKLGVAKLSGLSFHSSSDFLIDHHKSKEFIQEVLRLDLSETWGVSIYSPFELHDILSFGNPSYFQVPMSILDRQFLGAETMERLQGEGIPLHARSIFLQGVLLENPKSIPKYFSKWAPLLYEYQSIASGLGTTLVGLALNFVQMQPLVERVVVGVNSVNHLGEIFTAMQKSLTEVEIENIPYSDDRDFTDPRRWNSSEI